MVKVQRWVSQTLVMLLASVTLASAATGEGKRFEWTTESEDAKSLLADLQARIENFQFGSETIAAARKVVAADPSFAMGVYYLSATTPSPEAEAELEKAVKLAAKASEGERRFIEAMAKARAGGGASFQDAIPILEELAADYPQERLVQMILGQIYQGTGNAEKARGAFEKALEIGPESSRARSFIANDNLLNGQYVEARATFQSIEKELPKGSAPAPIRYGMAFSYLYEGKFDAAIQALETYLSEYRESGASQAFPEVFIWNSIARIHLENGKPSEAMAAYKKGYESIPESSLPDDQKQVWLGRLKHGQCRTLAKMGRHDEAANDAQEIYAMITEAGEDGEQYLPAYHYLMGYLHLEAGKNDKAVEHLKKANASDPFHTLLLARAYERAGDAESALATYESVVSSRNNGLERALAFPEAKRKLKKS